MVKKYLKKWLTPIIKEIFLDFIQEEPIKFKEISRTVISNEKKLDIFDIMSKFDIKDIQITRKLYDMKTKLTSNYQYENFNNVQEFHNYLKTYEYNDLNLASFSITVEYLGPWDTQRESKLFFYDTIVQEKELTKIHDPIIKWIEDRPELLI
jgi:hypothetical protein